MKEVGFGIIGIGRQGLRLADHIRNDIKPGKLIAVCRRSDSGHDYSKKHGLKFYSEYRDLLQDKNIHVVIITTPSSCHGIQAVDALQYGKHVLIDKPIASTLEEGRLILENAKKAKRTVAVNLPLRINPVTVTVKENLKKIGKLKKVQIVVSHGPLRSKWQSDPALSSGGVIMDLGSHYFDLVAYISGCQPLEVNNAYSEDAEVEHCGSVVLRYRDFSASIVLLRNQKLKKSIVTCAGEQGIILADYAMRQVIVSNHQEVSEIQCPAQNDFEHILHNMINAINKTEAPIADGEVGFRSLEAVLAVYRAIRTGAPVRF